MNEIACWNYFMVTEVNISLIQCSFDTASTTNSFHALEVSNVDIRRWVDSIF